VNIFTTTEIVTKTNNDDTDNNNTSIFIPFQHYITETRIKLLFLGV
jgi:hypothetical protein